MKPLDIVVTKGGLEKFDSRLKDGMSGVILDLSQGEIGAYAEVEFDALEYQLADDAPFTIPLGHLTVAKSFSGSYR